MNPILEDLRNKDPREFVAKYFFDSVPFVFHGDREKYVLWKERLGDKLGIDTNNIVIVGSGGLGISLNPVNNFSDFHQRSDIDVAIISSFHFLVSWRFLRNNNHIRMRLQEKQKSSWADHEKRYVYWGTIATDKLLGVLPFGKEWHSVVDSFEKSGNTFGRELKFRVYNDVESLRAYQIKSVADAKYRLISGA